jgi:hypothetical protein
MFLLNLYEGSGDTKNLIGPKSEFADINTNIIDQNQP